ncbi:MAG: PAS domain-containing protein, partial [Woeseia sp.]
MNQKAAASEIARLSASSISLPYQPRPREIRAKISRNAGQIMLVVGAVVLFGWLTGIGVITQWLPNWATMSFNTAFCFLLLGITFVLPGGIKDAPTPRMIGRAAAAAAGLLTVVSLLDYVFALGMDTNQWFFTYEKSVETPYVAQMSAATSSGLLLTSIAALTIGWRTKAGLRPSLVPGVIVGALGLIGLIGHVYDAQSLYAVPFFSGLSVHTSLLLAVASIGILGVHPDQGPLGVLAADGRGSRLARTLLPFGIVLPVLIGWARLQGERAGLYELEFGLALFATASVLAFIAMIWLTAASINREDILRRRADEAMEHEAIRRRILFEKAKDGILLLDAHQNVVEANSSFAEMIGYPSTAVAQLHPWDWIVDSRTRELVVADWVTLAKDGDTFEAQLRKRDGSIIDAEVSCTTARFDAQQFLFFVCRDITQRKNSQQALNASEQRFRRALANIPDVVVIYDTDLRIQYINNATRTVTGQSPDFFIGKRDEEVFPQEVYQAYMPSLRKAFLTKQISAVEVDIDIPDFGTRSLRITCVPLMDQDGDVREILGITRDLTERKQAESTVRASELKFRQLIEQAATGIVI